MMQLERLGKHGERLKRLRSRLRRRPAGEVVVDGRRLVADLVRWEVPLQELYLTPEAAAEPANAPLVEAAETTWEIDGAVLETLAPTRHPQGVLAVVAEPQWPSWRGDRGVALWLDGIQDPGNLGAIVRSAAGFGARAVLLSPGCVDPFSSASVRGAAGAVFRVPVEREVEIDDAASRARSHGGQVWAAGAGGTPISAWSPGEPLLLLIGTEGGGLSEPAAATAEGTVTVPLERGIESLNVAVAAAVLLAHLR